MRISKKVQKELNKLGYMGRLIKIEDFNHSIYVEYLRFSINKITIEKIKKAGFEFVNIKNEYNGMVICLFKSLIAD